MLKIYFATIHPNIIETYSGFGVYASAKTKNLAKIESLNLRDFAVDKHGSIDDYPYGGGDSMVMRPEPIRAAIESIENQTGQKPFVVYMTPKGKRWDHQESVELSAEFSPSDARPMLFICGRFAGVDQRVVDHMVDRQYSLGDFVISGGELACMTMADSILRHVPGVLGNQDSVDFDSFSSGLNGMLEYPVYTRPAEFEGHKVPDVLLSGNHKKIDEWRNEKSAEETKKFRPDLLDRGSKIFKP